MLRKEITYTDYAGTERTETHYFNMNKNEVIKWLSTSGGYTIDKIIFKFVTESNVKELIDVFDKLIYMSYGKLSLDNRRLDKSDEAKADFFESGAYDALFMELISTGSAMADFVNGIIPKDLADEVGKIVKENPNGIPDNMKDYISS